VSELQNREKAAQDQMKKEKLTKQMQIVELTLMNKELQATVENLAEEKKALLKNHQESLRLKEKQASQELWQLQEQA